MKRCQSLIVVGLGWTIGFLFTHNWEVMFIAAMVLTNVAIVQFFEYRSTTRAIHPR